MIINNSNLFLLHVILFFFLLFCLFIYLFRFDTLNACVLCFVISAGMYNDISNHPSDEEPETGVCASTNDVVCLLTNTNLHIRMYVFTFQQYQQYVRFNSHSFQSNHCFSGKVISQNVSTYLNYISLTGTCFFVK